MPVKNNLGDDQTGLAFSLRQRGGKATVEWEPDPVSMTADDAMAAENAKGKVAKQPGTKPDDRNEAVAFLHEALAKGPRLGKEIAEEAREVHSITKRTLERARKVAGVSAFRESPTGPWLWRLGHTATSADDHPAHLELWRSGGLDENPGETSLFDGDDPHTATMPESGNVDPGDELLSKVVDGGKFRRRLLGI